MKAAAHAGNKNAVAIIAQHYLSDNTTIQVGRKLLIQSAIKNVKSYDYDDNGYRYDFYEPELNNIDALLQLT